MHRYYSTLRPVTPGAFPGKPDKVENFDGKTYCKEIDREAWGYVEYSNPIAPEDAEAYELTPAGCKTYWCVTSSIDDRGRIISKISNKITAQSKPENTCTSTRRRDIYTDWFDTHEAAAEFIAEAQNA